MTRTSTNAYHDENDVPTLIAVSSVDNQTPVTLWADPTTHRLLTDTTGGSGFTELTATGTVNGNNVTFTFSQTPSYIVSDGVWLKKLDNNGGVQWSGTTTVTMTIPPANSIFGIA